MNTKEKILSQALNMFNERGIEYVGLRELAAILNMRVSNITYYFPTKDDLVNQLSIELNILNSEIVIVNENITMIHFLDMLNHVFQNQIKYRCLLLSFVHLMEQNKIMSVRYKKTQKNRNAAIQSNIESLVTNKYLKLNNHEEIDYIVSMLSLLIRFWISEAKVSLQHLNYDQQKSHYLYLITKLFQPYATTKGRKEIGRYLIQLI